MPEMKTYTMNGIMYEVVDAAGRERLKLCSPHNLLDNSDFKNPVNQRRQESYTGLSDQMTYTIDRWGFPWQDGATLTVGDGYIQKSSHCFCQRLVGINTDKIYTAALHLVDGTTYVHSGTFTDGFGSSNSTIWCGIDNTYNTFRIETGITQRIEWAALYEGEYTAETLPEYHPKGYGAELLECQRYYYQCDNYTAWPAYKSSSTYGFITLPTKMRTTPTVTATILSVRGSMDTEGAASEVTLASVGFNEFGNTLRLSLTGDDKTTNQVLMLITYELKISADL